MVLELFLYEYVKFCLPDLRALGGNPAIYKYNLSQGERLAL